jgi:hypothetical protein
MGHVWEEEKCLLSFGGETWTKETTSKAYAYMREYSSRPCKKYDGRRRLDSSGSG